MIRKKIAALVKEAGERCIQRGIFPIGTEIKPIIEIPKEPEHGDYSTNLAFLLARTLRKKPEEIAKRLIESMDFESVCAKVGVAAKGFVNFYVRDAVYRSTLQDLAKQGLESFLPDVGEGKRVLIEFVSANPTGPLHVGHGRGAAVGDVLANLLRKAGFDVVTEYYVNDAGRQIETLGRSVYLRWKEARGESVTYPETLYQGAYIKEIAGRIIAEAVAIPEDETEAVRFMARYAAEVVLTGIRKDLEDFGVRFDNYYHERTLFDEGHVDEAIDMLKKAGYLYEQEGALWFKMDETGDEKDRVIIKSDGEKTYFASDIAYHSQKFARKFGILIDIWGSDHHGYIPRLKASIEALGKDKENLKVILIQFVTLLRDGKPVGMSTRAGQFTTLREVMDEVGRDASRFFFLMRKSDAHLEFDLDLAKKTSNENPVYYVQYAHARIESIFRMAKEEGIDIASGPEVDASLLVLPEETALIKGILRFYTVIEGGARSLEPHRLTFYLVELVGSFHSYYNKVRVLKNEMNLTRARLMLLYVLQQAIRSGLEILGVSAPERM
ncbi:MAG TPA: arginine--tRNA ligase [Syntrophorhabdales bacterium]|nr:arginine--tRNA ligase [Syntrophorhabdales bacterium]